MSLNRRRRLWILLFVFAAGLLSTLATGWNVVLVRHYHRMMEVARNLSQPDVDTMPWGMLVLGTLGFVATLATIILFFIKILREMKLNQLQSEFLATVSHELKTPIASLELSSSLLRAGGLSLEEINSLWQSHEAELKRLREEVETILEAARWQSNPAMSRKNSVDLEHWITQSLPRWRSMLGPGAEIRRKGDPLAFAARGDSKTLNLIGDNLINNAKKFSDGSPRVEIITRRAPAKGIFRKPEWQIEIRDHGIGFDPADSKRIFNRFFRARHEVPYAIPGTGLGLYLASSASRALGIRLSGQSEGPGRGAAFTLQGRGGTA